MALLIALLALPALAATRTSAQSELQARAGWGSWGSRNGEFRYRIQLATDSAGNVYVSDWGNNRIQKFGPNGKFIRKWGSKGSGNGQFLSPSDVAVDGAGDVYVTDTGNNRIQKFSPNGKFIRRWGSKGSGNGRFNVPSSIATDASGRIYVTEVYNDRIQKFTSNGTFIRKWGSEGSGKGKFKGLQGIATDANSNVYVTDSVNDRIQKFTSNGIFIRKWGSTGNGKSKFDGPAGISVDAAGDVYVVDWYGDHIQKFTSNGTLVSQWRSYKRGKRKHKLTDPIGITTGTADDIYVSRLKLDRGSRRASILRLTLVPTISITSGPKGKTTERSATFRFKSPRSDTSFKCKLNKGKWKSCVSPKSYSKLRPGKYTFKVKGSSPEGKLGSPARRRFVVKGPDLPVKTIDFRGGKGLMTLTCPQSSKCQGTIEINRGKSALVKKRSYSITAHGKKRLKLRLTKVGRKALAKSRRVRATGTLTGKSGTKARFVAILK